MLAWPSIAMLKINLPDVIITALVPEYTRPMAEVCPWIDQVIIDKTEQDRFISVSHLSKIFKQYQFDAAISLFNQTRTGIACWLAGIPYRLGPATKLAQLFYNKRLKQRRSRSIKPEYEYNKDLIRHFLHAVGISEPEEPHGPYLHFDDTEVAELKAQFIKEHDLPVTNKLVFIHAGSGGSASNISINQYAKLARGLADIPQISIVLTAGPGEKDIANHIISKCKNNKPVIYHSQAGIVQFAKHIQFSDLFISGSTGPLHVAGALNCNTVGFFPNRRSSTSLRWQTLNDEAKRLAFSPHYKAEVSDMSTIKVDKVIDEIKATYFS